MANKVEAFWTRIFGLKIGDKVRLKYGKVDWTVYAIFPQYNTIKLIRYRILDSSPFSVMITIDLNSEVRKVG